MVSNFNFSSSINFHLFLFSFSGTSLTRFSSFSCGISFLLVLFTLVSPVMVHHIQFSGVFFTCAHFSSCDISLTLVFLVVFQLHLFLLLRYFTYTHFSCCGILPTLIFLPVVSHTEYGCLVGNVLLLGENYCSVMGRKYEVSKH